MGYPDYVKYLLMFLGTCVTMCGCVETDNGNPIHNNPFIIFPGEGKASVLQPNREEQWFIGSGQEIVWNPGVVPEDSTITLLLSLDGGGNYPHIIVSNTANDGSFIWIVLDLPSKNSILQIAGPVSRDV
ncbi:MAG: hypothetical protein QF879_03125, partial [Candidatus Latescibacteria bacterium]|nr:hypothetical protein [Candidatus Latescibacterota bacterium]